MAIRVVRGKLTASSGLIVAETPPLWQKRTALCLPKTNAARTSRHKREARKTTDAASAQGQENQRWQIK